MPPSGPPGAGSRVTAVALPARPLKADRRTPIAACCKLTARGYNASPVTRRRESISFALGRAIRNFRDAGTEQPDETGVPGSNAPSTTVTSAGSDAPRQYTWDYLVEVPPYDRIISVLEAFFASFPGGDYRCERRERYKLTFRRGAWRRSWLGLGRWTPERLVKGHFEQWPVVVRVLVRPSPRVFTVALRYEVHLPDAAPPLSEEVRTSVDQHARGELRQLAAYLAECIGLDTPPDVNTA